MITSASALCLADQDTRRREYHIIQSKMLIGSGGLRGKAGFQSGYFSPPADFVFAVLAEELGFGLLALYILLAGCG